MKVCFYTSPRSLVFSGFYLTHSSESTVVYHCGFNFYFSRTSNAELLWAFGHGGGGVDCYYISFVRCLLTAFYWVVVLLYILNPSPPSNMCFLSFFSQHDLPFHFLTMCLMNKRFSFHQVQLIVFFLNDSWSLFPK